MRKYLIAFLSLAAFCAGRLEAADDHGVREEIEAVEKKWVEAFNRHDAGALADLYLADAQSFLPDVGILKGQEAIRKHLKEMAKQEKELTQTVKTLEVFPQGDLATETGTWKVKNEDGSYAEEGSYWMVWQKKDDSWKVSREIWNTSSKMQKLADALKPLERLLGTWVSEGPMGEKSYRVMVTWKAASGGAAISSEGTFWLDGKTEDTWTDLIYYRPESKTIVDIGASKNDGHSSSEVFVDEEKIVFQETGFDQEGIAFVRASEFIFDGEKKMRLTQLFGMKGGKAIKDLLKDVEVRRVD